MQASGITPQMAGDRRPAIYTLLLKGDLSGTRTRLAGHPWVTSIRVTLSKAERRLAGQPWVASLRSQPAGGHTRWQVTVTDAAAAEAQLLRLVQSDEEVTVLGYRCEQESTSTQGTR